MGWLELSIFCINPIVPGFVVYYVNKNANFWYFLTCWEKTQTLKNSSCLKVQLLKNSHIFVKKQHLLPFNLVFDFTLIFENFHPNFWPLIFNSGWKSWGQIRIDFAIQLEYVLEIEIAILNSTYSTSCSIWSVLKT